MKSVKAKLVALMLAATLVFSGCMNEQISIVINSDGSGYAEMVIRIDKQEYIDAINSLTGETEEKLTASDIKELDAALISEGFKLVTVDGREYYQVSEKETVQKGELQKSFGGEAASYVTTDTVYLEVDMLDNDDVQEMQQQAETYGASMTADAVKFTVTVQMPKAIVSTNGTIDKTNPNKVTFDLPLDQNSTIFVTTKSGVTAGTVKEKIKKLNAIKAPKIKKLKANKVKAGDKKATVTLKLKKVKAAKNYQIAYATKKNFKKAAAKKTKKTTYTMKNLKKGTKYYVRVRAVKENYAGVEVYSKWTKKTVKTKK